MSLILSGLAFADAVSAIVWRANPNLALLLWPNDPRALAQKADALVQSRQPGDVATAVELARDALRASPLQIVALRVLGTASELEGKRARSAQQLALAGRLSRRDLKTQLWEIEAAVQRDDIPAALRHYDIALKTKPDSQQLLFPLLASGLDDPVIRAKFVPLLRSSPSWMLAFLIYAAERGSAPHALALLLSREQGSVGKWNADVPPRLLNRLLGTGDIVSAELYARSLPDYRVGLERTAALTPFTTAAALRPLTWTPQEQTGVFARVDTRRPVVNVYADAQSSGVVLQRFLSLPPGRYRLTTAQSFMTAGPGATARWSIRCLRNGHFVDQWSSRDPVITNRPTVQEEFVLPTGCLHQYVTLTVGGGVEAVPLEYDLTAISVRPLT